MTDDFLPMPTGNDHFVSAIAVLQVENTLSSAADEDDSETTPSGGYRYTYYLTNQKFTGTLTGELFLQHFSTDKYIKSKTWDDSLDHDEYVCIGTLYDRGENVTIASGGCLGLAKNTDLDGATLESGGSILICNGAHYSGLVFAGGAVASEQDLQLSGLTFSGQNASFLMPGSTKDDVLYNPWKISEGTVWIANKGNLSNCSFLNNKNGAVRITSVYSVGGLYFGLADGTYQLTVSDCLFRSNGIHEHMESGGAILSIGTLTVEKSDFIGNSTSWGGGAISGSGSFTISNSTFSDNVAGIGSDGYFSGHGGGAISAFGTCSLDGVTFTSNKASSGGAVVHYDEDNLSVSNCDFTSNYAYYDGGAISMAGSYDEYYLAIDEGIIGNGIISDSLFTDNSAQRGGAIYNKSVSTIIGCQFVQNRADYIGGAIYNRGNLSITDCRFSGNYAYGRFSGDNGGGAIINDGELTLCNTVFETASDTICNGGTIYIDGVVTTRSRWSRSWWSVGSVYNYGILNWDITDMGYYAYVVDSLANFTGSGAYALTIGSPKEDGSYYIGNNADNFHSKVFLANRTLEDYGDCISFVWDPERNHYNDLYLDGQYYWLTSRYGTLTLLAGEGNAVRLYRDDELLRRGHWMEDVVLTADGPNRMEIESEGEVWNLDVGADTFVYNYGGTIHDLTVRGEVSSWNDSKYMGTLTISGHFSTFNTITIEGPIVFELCDDVTDMIMSNYAHIASCTDLQVRICSNAKYGNWGLIAEAGDFDGTIVGENEEYKLWIPMANGMLIRTVQDKGLRFFKYSLPASLDDLQDFLYSSQMWDWEISQGFSFSLPDLNFGIEKFGPTVNKRKWLRFSVTNTALSYVGSDSNGRYEFKLQSDLSFTAGILTIEAELAGTSESGLYLYFENDAENKTFSPVDWDLIGKFSVKLQRVDHRFKLFDHVYTVEGFLDINTKTSTFTIGGEVLLTGSRTNITVTASFTKLFDSNDENALIQVENNNTFWDSLSGLSFKGENLNVKFGYVTVNQLDLQWKQENDLDVYRGSVGMGVGQFSLWNKSTLVRNLHKVFGVDIKGGTLSAVDLHVAGAFSSQGDFAARATVTALAYRVNGTVQSLLGTTLSLEAMYDTGKADTTQDDVFFAYGEISFKGTVKGKGSITVTDDRTTITCYGKVNTPGWAQLFAPELLEGGVVYEKIGDTHWITVWGKASNSGEDPVWMGTRFNLTDDIKTDISKQISVQNEIDDVYEHVDAMHDAVGKFIVHGRKDFNLYSIYGGAPEDLTVTVTHESGMCYQLRYTDFLQDGAAAAWIGQTARSESRDIKRSLLTSSDDPVFTLMEFSDHAFRLQIANAFSGEWTITVQSDVSELSNICFAAAEQEDQLQTLILQSVDTAEDGLIFQYECLTTGETESRLYLCCDVNDNGHDGRIVTELDRSGNYTMLFSEHSWWTENNSNFYLMFQGETIPSFSNYVDCGTRTSVNFDLSLGYDPDDPCFHRWQNIANAEELEHTITVSATQAEGVYSLAEGAAEFDQSVTVYRDDTALGRLSVGESLTAGDRVYSLAKTDGLLSFSVAAVVPVVTGGSNDLNGDGRADIVMSIDQATHPADGSTGAWLILGDQTAAWGDLSQRNEGWEIFGMGKTSAGKTTNDVYVKSEGNVIGAWTTNESGAVSGWETVGEFSADTQVLGLGDFNGNGQTDLLLRSTYGDVGCYFTGGDVTGWNYFQSLGDEWKISAVGDLNGDGRDDVVLKHDAGFAGSWLTQSDYTMAWADLDTLPDGFEIVGAGDFNADGTDDVLLKNGNYYGAWLVQDGNAADWFGIGDLGDVTVEQIADFDGDGVDDLRIRTAAGDLGTQLIKGSDTLDWKYYGSVGAEWSTSLAAL